MATSDIQSAAAGVPEVFVEQVKKALENLYDFAYLQKHPLGQYLDTQDSSPHIAKCQHLRRHLIEAIETLNPGHGTPFRSPNSRLYNVVNLHYVEGLTIQETAYELGISERQAYRYLRRAEEGVAAVLWPHIPPTSDSPVDIMEPDVSSVQSEIASLKVHLQQMDARQIIQRGLTAVKPLASSRGAQIVLSVPGEPVIISTEPIIAQQVLVSILSSVIQSAQGEIHLNLKTTGTAAAIALDYKLLRLHDVFPWRINDATHKLLQRLKWRVETQRQDDDQHQMRIILQASHPLIVVIDDNEGLEPLINRYLTGCQYRLVAAVDGREGLRLIQQTAPDVIILDVMLPGMDGWEILQRLRNQPETMKTPVIICSVFDDPELALSLGASAVLPKPLNQLDLLGALQKLNII
jgi:CheY-like chemotaxis protein